LLSSRVYTWCKLQLGALHVPFEVTDLQVVGSDLGSPGRGGRPVSCVTLKGMSLLMCAGVEQGRGVELQPEETEGW
jgi:hypothetical protein